MRISKVSIPIGIESIRDCLVKKKYNPRNRINPKDTMATVVLNAFLRMVKKKNKEKQRYSTKVNDEFT